MKILTIIMIVLFLLTSCFQKKDIQTVPSSSASPKKEEKKDELFLMGVGMLRLNFTSVEGDAIRFRYSDLGLPADFSTRERASFMVDGTLANQKYNINGFLNYDPENRITEPALEFLVTIGNDNQYLSVGDYRNGVFLDSIFSRYYHPFRGAIIGYKTDRFGIEFLGGVARGESNVEEIPAGLGAGPYYLEEAPIIRGSEIVYLVVKSSFNLNRELKRTQLIRNQDYFLDNDRGVLLFNYSLYPVDELGNPVEILVSYQFESLVGRFTRAVFGLRTFFAPLEFLKLNFSYIADSDSSLEFEEAIKNRRGIYTFGLNIDSKPVTFFGEFSVSSEPSAENQNGFFGGGVLNISKKLKFFFNSWSLDSNFPTFANEQLQYEYSLNQIFPSYSNRNIFLSPFQFTRNIGTELFPFYQSGVSIDEKEYQGFLEWDDGINKISTGYGMRKGMSIDDPLQNSTFFVSSFHDGSRTKLWGKFGLSNEFDDDKEFSNSRIIDALVGVRERAWKNPKGELFVQADYKGEAYTDFLDILPNTIIHTASLLVEYLTGKDGFFAGFRKEILRDEKNEKKILDADIYEVGVRHKVYKGFFLDSRYRQEISSQADGDLDNKILSLGGGFESKKFRAMGRYELQLNKNATGEGRRNLWSLFLFGTPVKRMSLSLRYYHQMGKDEAPTSLTERSEEQLSLRFIWRPTLFLSLYSQWRYDSDMELLPPLEDIKSNTLASIQGLKLNLAKKLEFLANYKLLKVWGPIENWKKSAAAELGYLIFPHFRLGVGLEFIDFQDLYDPLANYETYVGYMKLVAIY
jgi:hypothetical protein